MILKVTDDKICLKYKTSVSKDMKKIEKFNCWWLEQATRKTPQLDLSASSMTKNKGEELKDGESGQLQKQKKLSPKRRKYQT